MGNEDVTVAIERMERAITDAAGVMAQLVENMTVLRARVDAGEDFISMVRESASQGGPAFRREVVRSFRDVQRSVMQIRAVIVRELVDREGMTLTAAGQVLEVSRQKASRLYNAAHHATSALTDPKGA